MSFVPKDNRSRRKRTHLARKTCLKHQNNVQHTPIYALNPPLIPFVFTSLCESTNWDLSRRHSSLSVETNGGWFNLSRWRRNLLHRKCRRCFNCLTFAFAANHEGSMDQRRIRRGRAQALHWTGAGHHRPEENRYKKTNKHRLLLLMLLWKNHKTAFFCPSEESSCRALWPLGLLWFLVVRSEKCTDIENCPLFIYYCTQKKYINICMWHPASEALNVSCTAHEVALIISVLRSFKEKMKRDDE